jgi:glycosyltransferase involved in cell wall biosynthesis
VLMETAAMGRPAVATDIRGCHDVVVDGETGLLVPPADVTALTAAVLRLLQDEKLTRTMGAAARRRAEEHFDERKVFQQIEAEYRVLFASKGLRPYNRDGALRTDAQQS